MTYKTSKATPRKVLSKLTRPLNDYKKIPGLTYSEMEAIEKLQELLKEETGIIQALLLEDSTDTEEQEDREDSDSTPPPPPPAVAEDQEEESFEAALRKLIKRLCADFGKTAPDFVVFEKVQVPQLVMETFCML
jgi:hypothetical protein